MSSSKYTLHYWKCKFIRPMKMGNLVLNFREGYDIKLNGVTVSELSPLPGLHLEALDEAKSQIEQYFQFEKSPSSLFPSVQFSLDAVESPNKLQRPLSAQTNALYLPILGDEKTRPWRELLELGHPIIKIKVGRQNLDFEKMILEEMLQDLGQAKFRIDANKSLSVQELEILLTNIPINKIDYLEAPLKDDPTYKTWNDFFKKTSIPLALDEDVIDWFQENIFPQGLKSIVLKPQLLGGLKKCREIAMKAKKNNITTVISSCYEGPTGLSLLASFAEDLNDRPVIHGLSTLSLLENL